MIRNRPNPLKPVVDDILSEIGDPTHSKPILEEMRPIVPDKEEKPKEETKPSKEENKPDNTSKPDNSNNTSSDSNQPKPNPTPSPSPSPSNQGNEYFSHYLTEEDKKKLIRYSKLNLDRVRDNWEEELDRLKKNQSPYDLPPTWREELRTIEELRKRPTWEDLHKATSEEKAKYSDYQNIKDTLKTWTEAFGISTAEQIKKKLDEKPVAETISPTDKEAIENYTKLKEKYNTLKTQKDKEVGDLKQTIKIKNSEIEKLKGWKTQPAPGTLVEQIRQKIVQAYNSTDYLNGYYEKLMKQFLNWEIAGNEEQKNALITTKAEINKCVKFLEEIATIKNPNSRL